MKKGTKIIIALTIIVAIILVVTMCMNSSKEENPGDVVNNQEQAIDNTTSSLQITNADDLSTLVDNLYEGKQDLYPSLATQVIDITDKDAVSYATGLENGDNLEFLVVSEPMMSSQAYSLVLAKVKSGVNADEIAKKMNENIDARKWICVTAEKVYATSSNDIVCLVMSSEEMASPVYEQFKKLAGNINNEYIRTEEEPELPADMY